MTDVRHENFITRAGFQHGWRNLESWARRMAEQAVREIEACSATGRDLRNENQALRALLARWQEASRNDPMPDVSLIDATQAILADAVSTAEGKRHGYSDQIARAKSVLAVTPDCMIPRGELFRTPGASPKEESS